MKPGRPTLPRFLDILRLCNSAKLGKHERFKDLSEFDEFACFILGRRIFREFSRTKHRRHGLIDGGLRLFVLT